MTHTNTPTTYDLGTGLQLIKVPNLKTLATQINETAREAERQARGATENALIVGAMLIQAKKLVIHGEWDNWILQNCEIAPRTVQAYMRLAKALPQLGAQEAQRVADLPVREAIRAIATNPDAPKKFNYTDVRLAKKDDADRAVNSLRKSTNALKAATRNIEVFRAIKGAQVAALKKKLTDALDAIERMEADSAAQTSEVTE